LAAEDLIAVIERQLRERPPLGMLAIEQRKLSMKQLFAVLQCQAESNRPFGRIAVELGFLSPSDVLQLVGLQHERCRLVAEHIVEMGLLDAQTVQLEMQRFHAARRRELGDQSSPSDRESEDAIVARPARKTLRRAQRSSAKNRPAATSNRRKA
jgi:hypothetical protein